MTTLTPDPGWEYLLTEAGRQLVDDVSDRHLGGESLERLGTQLRKTGLEVSVVAASLTQADLRVKARGKFGDLARRLLFTHAGLEQASRDVVAAEHAARFQRAGVRSVSDLGCGVGAESLALLAAGITVRAIEIDPFTARLAAHNLAVLSAPVSAEVVTGDATIHGTDDTEGAFLDPARRTSGHRDTKRVASPDDYSPSLTFAFDIAERMPTGIKLGPGFDRELIPETVEAQWVSVNGSVVETALWSRSLRRPGVTRSALLIEQRGGVVSRHELTAASDAPDAATGSLGEFLYEPDGAVIRARLIGQLAERLGTTMLDPHIAYMTSDAHVFTPFAHAFRIIAEVPTKEKALRKALASRGIGSLEIKKRGVDVNPATLRQRLKLTGDTHATLIMTRIGDRHRAWLCERI